MLKSERTRSLKQLKNQGKVAHSFGKSKVSSLFNRTGDYLRFTDWRFIHPARLNLLSLNAMPYSSSRNYLNKENPKQCRKCSHEEMLAHVINHCPEHMQCITARHNRIVNRIKMLQPKNGQCSEKTNRSVVKASGLISF